MIKVFTAQVLINLLSKGLYICLLDKLTNLQRAYFSHLNTHDQQSQAKLCASTVQPKTILFVNPENQIFKIWQKKPVNINNIEISAKLRK